MKLNRYPCLYKTVPTYLAKFVYKKVNYRVYGRYIELVRWNQGNITGWAQVFPDDPVMIPFINNGIIMGISWLDDWIISLIPFHNIQDI